MLDVGCFDVSIDMGEDKCDEGQRIRGDVYKNEELASGLLFVEIVHMKSRGSDFFIYEYLVRLSHYFETARLECLILTSMKPGNPSI